MIRKKHIPSGKRRDEFSLQAGPFTLALGRQTRIMGVINVTPDSFSRDGCMRPEHKDFTKAAVSRALRMVRQGADIIDIGGESTRPGAAPIACREEIERIVPAIRKLSDRALVPISVDTYKPLVARHSLDAGARIVNMVMGTPPDRTVLKMARDYSAAIVLMHIKGTPRTMQKNIHYADLIPEIISALRKSLEICLEIGIKSDRIMIDPGIGFGKNTDHNLEIINRLDEFRSLGLPILLGPSRKSFIGNVLGKDVSFRIWGTSAAVSAGIMRGAHVVRVHDVREMAEVAKMTDAIINQSV